MSHCEQRICANKAYTADMERYSVTRDGGATLLHGQQTVILDPSATYADAPISVALPRVHLAGSDAHYDAHIEVGRHGFALFLAPTAKYPPLDIDGTREQ